MGSSLRQNAGLAGTQQCRRVDYDSVSGVCLTMGSVTNSNNCRYKQPVRGGDQPYWIN